MHLVNLTNAGTWRQPVQELIPIGPLQVKVKLPNGVAAAKVRLLVSERVTTPKSQDGWVTFELKSILDHEVVVIG